MSEHYMRVSLSLDQLYESAYRFSAEHKRLAVVSLALAVLTGLGALFSLYKAWRRPALPQVKLILRAEAHWAYTLIPLDVRRILHTFLGQRDLLVLADINKATRIKLLDVVAPAFPEQMGVFGILRAVLRPSCADWYYKRPKKSPQGLHNISQAEGRLLKNPILLFKALHVSRAWLSARSNLTAWQRLGQAINKPYPPVDLFQTVEAMRDQERTFLSWVKENKKELESIPSIDFDGLQLFTIPPVIYDFPKLQCVSFYRNFLLELPLCPPHLKSINITHNPVKVSPKDLEKYEHLRRLYLSEHQIKFKAAQVPSNLTLEVTRLRWHWVMGTLMYIEDIITWDRKTPWDK